MKCPNCGNTVQDDALFCDQCGASLQQTSAAPAGPVSASTATASSPMPPPESGRAVEPPALSTTCPACGAENMPGEMFCVDCGTPLQAPMPEEPLPAQEMPAEQPPMMRQMPTEPAPASQQALQAMPDESEVISRPAFEPAASAPEPAPAPTPLVCAACGAPLDPGDAFCSACGTKVEAPASVATPAAAQAPAPAASAPAAAAAAAPAAQGAPAAAPGTAAPEPAAPAGQAAQLTECPACGAAVTPGAAFCEFCGAALVVPVAQSVAHPVTAGAPASGVASMPAPEPAGTMSGDRPRLVVPDTGNELPLILDTEMLVGREDPYSNLFPDVDLSPYGAEEKGVSRRHFKLTLAEGQYAIQDLASTNYTFLNQQRLEPNVPVRIQDGDEIRAGRLRLVFRTRP